MELCLHQNIPIARFFFCRSDPSRNSIKHLVATLVYQLLQTLPALIEIVVPRIQLDPLIFNKSLQTQFEYLIFDPLRKLHCQSSYHPTLVLLFDGIDECNNEMDQGALIRILSCFVGTTVYPVIAFFASRPEHHISASFRSAAGISQMLYCISLDDRYLPDQDIRLYLIDSLHIIKSTHQFGHLLGSDWPFESDVEDIVIKSSGQFVYASVVARFLSMPDLHPAQQLEIVRGIRPSGKLTPFAQLDALYQHILSRVRDVDFTSLVLAWMLFSSPKMPSLCAACLQMDVADVHVGLAALTSVVSIQDDFFQFLHASLPDFLLDPDRAQKFLH